MSRRIAMGALAALLCAALVAPPAASAQAGAVEDQALVPEVTASAWILYDATADRILGTHNPDERRPMASTTKMMTALLALEGGSASDLVTVSDASASIGGAQIGLVAGEQIVLDDLLAALLLQSANDAAIAIAEHVAGSESRFVEEMNGRAVALGMDNTAFVNPHGLDTPGHYSSARDLLTLAQEAMTHPDFARLVALSEVTLTPAPNGAVRVATNRNELIGSYDGAIGIKTGFTDDAGLVLASAATRSDRTLYAVVMNSEDHFADSIALLDYGFDAHLLYQLIESGPAVVSATLQTASMSFTGPATVQRAASQPAAGRVVVTGPSAGAGGGDSPPGWADALSWPLEYWSMLWAQP